MEERRRALWVLGAVTVLAVVWFVVGALHDHHPRATSTSTTTMTAPGAPDTSTAILAPSTIGPSSAGAAATTTTEPSPAQIDAGQGPTPQQEAIQRAVLAARPAFQHLPWSGDGIQIAVIGYTQTRAVLAVSTSYDLAQAKAVYSAFLARYHDSGRGYVPQFHVGLGQPGGAPPGR